MHTYGCIILPITYASIGKQRTTNTKIGRGEIRNYKTLLGLASYPSIYNYIRPFTAYHQC